MAFQQTLADRPGFERAYPRAETIDILYELRDLSRAVEAYRFFYPSVSMEGIFNGLREVGLADGHQLAILAAGPRHVGFTVSSDTPYLAGAIDLAAMGPVAVDVPAGAYLGLINDHHQRWVVDLGLSGADAGNGGRYIITPPGFAGRVPRGFHMARAETYTVLLELRALPVMGGIAGAVDALRRVKVYALADHQRPLPFVEISDRPVDITPLRWEGNLGYWERLAAIVEAEPVIDEFRPMYGELAALGIQKGMPFAPTTRMARRLERAAREALDEMRVEAFASMRTDRLVWCDRRWEWIGLVPDDGDFETVAFLDLEARDRWFHQATVASPSMFRRGVGCASLDFLATRDATGQFLDGGREYRLEVAEPVPADLFWSVTAYDARTRSQVLTQQDRATLGSVCDVLKRTRDGSIDIYLGPEAPQGNEQQWIQTNPETGFFLYFRLYAPDTHAFDGTWRLGDIEPIT